MSDTQHIKLSERLDAVLEVQEEQKKQEIIQDFVQDKDSHADFEYARCVIKDMVEVGKEAVEELNTISKETQQARHYEVLANLIKTTTDNAEKIIDIRRKKMDLERGVTSDENSVTNTNNGTVTNNTFIGTTADLLKMIKDAQKGDSNQPIDVTPENGQE